MNPSLYSTHDKVDFDFYKRGLPSSKDNCQELHLMIIDIETRETRLPVNDGTKSQNEPTPLYVGRQLFDMKKSPLMMRSLFLPDEEDVFFLNNDIEGSQPEKQISDEEIESRGGEDLSGVSKKIIRLSIGSIFNSLEAILELNKL